MTEHGPATESLRHKAAQLTGQFDDTEVLRRASVATHPPQNVALLYETILDAAVEIMGADFASMQMLHPERGANGELRLLASRGYPPDAAAAWEWIAADHATTCGIAMKTGRRVILSDVETQSDMVGTEARQDYLRIGMRSVQSTPLLSRTGALVGMVSTGWRTPHEPGERDLRLLDIVARQAADLIESRAAQEALRASEEKFRLLADLAPSIVWMAAPDGTIAYASEQWFRFTGVDRAQNATGWPELVLHPDDRERCIAAWTAALKEGSDYEIEVRNRRHDGVWRWCLTRARPQRDAGGAIVRWFGTTTDIDDRKRAEEALRASEEGYRKLIGDLSAAIYTTDADGRIDIYNEAAVALWGRVPVRGGDQWCGSWRIFAPDGAPIALDDCPMALTLRDGVARRGCEIAIERPDGSRRSVLANPSPLRDATGKLSGAVNLLVDITERKRIEEALRESEEKYARLFGKAAFVAALATYPEGVFVEVNDSFESMFGYSRQEAVGKTSRELGINPDVPRRAQFIAELRHDGHILGREAEFFTRSGEARTCLTNVTLLDVGGQPHALSTLQDITERKRAEEQLRRSFGTYLALIENNPFGVYLVDADFRLAKISEGAQSVFAGIEPLIGRDFAEVLRIIWPAPFAGEVIERFRHTLASGEAYRARDTTQQRGNIENVESYDWKIERVTLPDGRFGVVCYFYDMTERRRHEEHVRLLMHEVNHRSKNLLSVVQSIARQTAASGRDDFLDVLEQRLGALAASQNLLISSEWRPVALEKLVRVQLAHVEDLIDDRITLAGPPVRVSAAGAQALGMALHELATNATKYGALASKAGRVAIAWELGPWERGARRFAISWTESGGPPVTAPARRGFGSTVIERMAAMSLEAEVSLDFAAEGLRWRLECAEGAGIVGGGGE